MTHRFNTEGPCRPELHYMLPPLERVPRMRKLVEQGRYFVLHAPRQSGKTTAILALAEELIRAGTHVAVVLSVEVARAFDEPAEAEARIRDEWRATALRRLPPELQPPPWPGTSVTAALTAWALAAPRPLALLVDEADCLAPRVLATMLSQLRSGFPDRPRAFPASVTLVGLRNVRDYVLAAGGSGRRGAGSPFNVSAAALTLGDFSRDEVARLYAQHSDETGQAFEDEAVDLAWELTRGQPWLVNAIARDCVEELVTDPAVPVSSDDVDRARRGIVRRQETHLDSLAERLREDRVRRVLEPVLAGQALPRSVSRDDLRYVIELGLLRTDDGSTLSPANPIYAEVLPRVLAENVQASLPAMQPSWLDGQGRLVSERLLDAFLAFWRRHGEPLLGAAPYPEIAPHLVLMAFLHRVANAGGTVEREYAIGSGRMDLCLRLGGVTVAMELKVRRRGRPDPEPEGLAQLDRYLAGLGLETGWLVIFDRRPDLPPAAERTCVRPATTPAGREVVVVEA